MGEYHDYKVRNMAKNYWKAPILVYVRVKKGKKKASIEVLDDKGNIVKNGRRLPKALRKRLKKVEPKYKRLLK